MPLNLSTTNPIVIIKPDYQPLIVTGFTPTVIVGSGGTTVTNPFPNNYIISTPLNILPTVLIGSGATTTTHISGNTWNINSPIVDTSVFVSKTTFDGYTGTTAPLQFAAKIHTHPYSGLTGLPNLGLYETVVNFNNYTGTTAPLQFANKVNFNAHTGDTTIHFKQSGITLTQNQVTGLVTALAGKSGTGHTHSYTGSSITDKPNLGLYETVVNFNSYTGTTAPLQFAAKIHTHPYSGLTGLPTLFTGNTFVASGGTLLGYNGNELTIFSPQPIAADWQTLPNRPNWLTGTTLSMFEASHTHPYSGLTGLPNLGLYETKINFNNYTGTTAPAQFESKTNFNLYTGTTAPNTYALKSNFNAHSGDTTIHFKQSGITISESQVTNLPTDLSFLQTEINNLAATQTADRIYVFQHEASNIATYETLSPTVLSLTGATEVIAATAGTSPVFIDAYVSPSDGLGVTGITSGVWTLHFHAGITTGAANQAAIRCQIYTRTVGNVETLRFTFADVPLTSASILEYQLQETEAAITGLVGSERLVAKMYVVATANRTVTWSYGTSLNNAYLQVPIKTSTAPLWANIQAKPAWLAATTLGGFETGHTHSQYATQAKVNTYTGTTAVATFAPKAAFNTFTGTTAPATYQSKTSITTYTGTTAPNTFQSKTSIATLTGTTLPSTYMAFNATITGITGTYTVKASDANKIIEADGTFTITLPNGMATGMMVDIVNVGTGTITIAASTTLHSVGTKLVTRYTGLSAYHSGSNVWTAVGLLTT